MITAMGTEMSWIRGQQTGRTFFIYRVSRKRKHISNHSIWMIARISQKYSVEVQIDLESGLMIIRWTGGWVRKSWHDAPGNL